MKNVTTRTEDEILDGTETVRQGVGEAVVEEVENGRTEETDDAKDDCRSVSKSPALL